MTKIFVVVSWLNDLSSCLKFKSPPTCIRHVKAVKTSHRIAMKELRNLFKPCMRDLTGKRLVNKRWFSEP